MPLFATLSHQIYLSAPLFILIFPGFSLTRFGKWPASISEGMNRFVFNVALPCMLLRVMSDFHKSSPVDFRLLFALFGCCLLVFIVGRVLATRLFRLDGVAGDARHEPGAISCERGAGEELHHLRVKADPAVADDLEHRLADRSAAAGK